MGQDPNAAIVYFRIHDLTYPRNSRIRRSLSEQYEIRCLPRSSGNRGMRRWYDEARSLWRATQGAQVIVLSEFNLQYAALAWAVAKMRGMGLVVDGFVGMFETEVEDKKSVSASSLKGVQYRLLDALARRVSDVYLIDTEVRAQSIRERTNSEVLALPVGAPSWANAEQADATHLELRVLYYGNYIALHGLDVLVPAVRAAAAVRRIEFTLIGDGESRSAIENMAADWPENSSIAFIDPVPQTLLADHIARSDLVLGVFGSSQKAASVIANKVWQGLASGRRVLTQRSPALDEIELLSDGALIQVDPSVAAVSRCLASLDIEYTSSAQITADLENYVEKKFKNLKTVVRDLSPRSHWK